MIKDDTKFSKIRSFFWPIHRYELVKFVPMLLLFFFITFDYHLLHIIKDTLIITAPNSGAEVLPFLKVWVMLPIAVIFTFVFMKLATRLNREKLFYAVLGGFLFFFFLFLLFLYPFREHLYLNHFSDYLQKTLPPGFKGLIALIRYWMFSLFYVMAESWSNIVFSVLLWGFANEVTSVAESRRFYALFGIGVNSSAILAGELGSYISCQTQNSWDLTFNFLVGCVLVVGFISIAIYRWLHIKVFVDHLLPSAPGNSYSKHNKPKVSLWEDLVYVARSRYLLYIAILVIAYNIAINLTEILWKSQVNELFHDPQKYTGYISEVTFFVGIIATLGSYFISGNIIRHFGWKSAALITPLIIFLTGIGFFYFFLLKNSHQPMPSFLAVLGMSPLALAVFFGSLQNCLSRSAKYTVFDDTKEMAFIPLSSQDRLKGKSAIDGIGSRLGKSGSSLILQVLFIFFSSFEACSSMVFIVILSIIPLWILSIHFLDKKFHLLAAEKAKEIPQVAKQKEEILEPIIQG